MRAHPANTPPPSLSKKNAKCTLQQNLDSARAPRHHFSLVFDNDGGGAALCTPAILVKTQWPLLSQASRGALGRCWGASRGFSQIQKAPESGPLGPKKRVKGSEKFPRWPALVSQCTRASTRAQALRRARALRCSEALPKENNTASGFCLGTRLQLRTICELALMLRAPSVSPHARHCASEGILTHELIAIGAPRSVAAYVLGGRVGVSETASAFRVA